MIRAVHQIILRSNKQAFHSSLRSYKQVFQSDHQMTSNEAWSGRVLSHYEKFFTLSQQAQAVYSRMNITEGGGLNIEAIQDSNKFLQENSELLKELRGLILECPAEQKDTLQYTLLTNIDMLLNRIEYAMGVDSD